MKTRYVLFLMLISVLLFSCKGKKKNNNPDNGGNNQEVIVSSERNEAHVAAATNVFKQVAEYKTIETQFSLKFSNSERNVSASGTLRVSNDSVMWLYIKALGFEVARAKFTQDSVWAVVKLKNQYFKGDYSLVQKFIPIAADYNILQSLFLNRMFIVPENKVESLDYFSTSMKDNKILELSTLSNPAYLQKFQFNNSISLDIDINRMVKSVIQYPQKNITVSVNYSEYEEFSGVLLPKVMDIDLADNHLSFVINKVTIDKNLQFPLSIPSNYKPIEF